VRNWRTNRDAGLDVPLMTPPDHVAGEALGAIAYRKPGAVLLTLRNHVVGAEAFDRAFREYTRRWAFRHPTPADFFRTVENVSGMDLSWYWRSFFYTSDVLDIAVEGVTNRTAGGETIATLALRRTTSVPFPVQARLKLADGTTRDVRFPVDLWGRPHVGARVEASVAVAANVVGVRLWPDGTVPDWDASNDTWGDAPAAGATAQVTGGGLSGAVGGR
jgi:aminopeptidase N